MKPWSDAGCFHELETMDLRDVFCASQPGDETNQTTLASIVRGTGGSLKRLLIDNGCAGANVTETIASKGGCLEELSMPCCTGLSDTGLQAIAAASTQLRRLCVGGPSRCSTPYLCLGIPLLKPGTPSLVGCLSNIRPHS